MSGTVIGNYRIICKLGEGGMGQVFRAIDVTLQREVAIKILHPYLTQDEAMLQRFRAEAITLAKLNHPNIALLYSFIEHGDECFMVMEYVPGETLESLLRRCGALPLRQALELFCQVLRGFEHAHAKSVIHRDIKPSNVMLREDGQVKITDFGIARVLGATKLTRTGRLIGTPEYMSPEQIQGREQDARSDIYSLGILLYEMVTGRVPFSGASDFEIMRAQLDSSPPSARDLIAGLPSEVETSIRKTPEKDPEARFQSVEQFRRTLEPIIEQLPATGQRILPQTPTVPETRIVNSPDRVILKETRLADRTGAESASLPFATTKSSKVLIFGGVAVGGLIAAILFSLMVVLPLIQKTPRVETAIAKATPSERVNSGAIGETTETHSSSDTEETSAPEAPVSGPATGASPMPLTARPRSIQTDRREPSRRIDFPGSKGLYVGHAYNRTFHQSGRISVEITELNVSTGRIRAHVVCSGGLIGEGNLSGRVSPDGTANMSGRFFANLLWNCVVHCKFVDGKIITGTYYLRPLSGGPVVPQVGDFSASLTSIGR